ncbi:MAG: serine--tRNA ligase [Nitrospinota bacterium]
MLDIKMLRENPDEVMKRIGTRGQDIDPGEILGKEKERRDLLGEVERLKCERNLVSKRIGEQKKRGEDTEGERERMKEVSARIKELDLKIKGCEEEISRGLLIIPNIPHSSVPIGTDEVDNIEVRRWGILPCFGFEPRSHEDIGERLNILDFRRGTKITGTKFVLYNGFGARLERGLINFMLDLHTREHGYREVFPPFIVNRDSMVGTGQLPKFEDDLFKLKGEESYYLIPTGEVPLTNIHKDEIIPIEDLPICYAAYTPCFRREAGSHGKDTTGLIRQHQFDKVELVKLVEPDSSYEELESLLKDAEEVLKRLNLHYRIVNLCAGDIGFCAAKTYDIEVWLPSQKTYREISSCSNFEAFQARRARIRYKKAPKSKPEYLHTLNGSGLAVGRLMVALLENYQEEDGSVTIPEALRPYVDGVEKITND